MPLPIPMQEAVNAEEVAAYEAQQKENKGQNVPEEEVVRRKIPFEKCLEEFMAEENVGEEHEFLRNIRPVMHNLCADPRLLLSRHPRKDVRQEVRAFTDCPGLFGHTAQEV